MGELHASIAIPSIAHSYSIGIEYMKNWFLKEITNKNFFKTVYIDGKHTLDDFRQFNATKSLKKDKPSVAIVPQLQFDHDRDKLDSYPYGLRMYARTSKLDSSFFKDKNKNIYVGIVLEEMKINFSFKVRLSTRAEQIDIFKFMQMAYRIGYTQEEFLDLDFHIPYSLMLQLAYDTGFKVEEDKIINVLDFISYLNSHSVTPILYKYRAINGKNEFFVRISGCYTHIACPDPLDPDDGERINMISDNFMITMNAELKMPCPKMYMYYSEDKQDILENIETATLGVGMFNITFPNIPDKNEKGWGEHLRTEYYYNNELNKPITIDFNEFFAKENDIGRLIEHNKNINISPYVFLDLKLFNGGKEIQYIMDWDKLILNTKDIITDNIVNIIIYTDLLYMNNQIITLDQLNRDRLR